SCAASPPPPHWQPDYSTDALAIRNGAKLRLPHGVYGPYSGIDQQTNGRHEVAGPEEQDATLQAYPGAERGAQQSAERHSDHGASGDRAEDTRPQRGGNPLILDCAEKGVDRTEAEAGDRADDKQHPGNRSEDQDPEATGPAKRIPDTQR